MSSFSGPMANDLVAIFHASFHPTRGNVIDWSLKVSDDIELDNLEFSALPSGLHLVDQDIVYFSKNGYQGACAFRRVKSTEQGHRGFRLSSLGILVEKTARPRPWQHVSALKDLVAMLYASSELIDSSQPLEPDWVPVQRYWEEHRVRDASGSGVRGWEGWSHELDGSNSERLMPNPTLHLPHLLRILGPSTLTLYKHVIGRKRILIYTLPPVEAACILCQVAADFCYEQQIASAISEASSGNSGFTKLAGKNKEGISVLGMITLSDVDRLQAESKSGRGWIACTTDAIFLEKPSHYDLLIDLTTSTPSKASRPTFYSSRPVSSQQPSSSRGPTHKLSTIRFAWSDVKLWNELERILSLDSSHTHDLSCCSPASPSGAYNDPKYKAITAWTDVWRVYEDVCLVCAGLWIGTWRGNSPQSYSTADGASNWGAVRLEGDDDLTLNSLLNDAATDDGATGSGSGQGEGSRSGGGSQQMMRSLGMGIEGRPVPPSPSARTTRRTSAMSWSSGRATLTGSTAPSRLKDQDRDRDQALQEEPELVDDLDRRNGQLLTTLALLQTFHAHTSFQLSTLESFLPPKNERNNGVMVLSPKEILTFELGPFSSVDERYLEWLASEYGEGSTLVIKRSWKDFFGVVFGYS
ncbi:hypothetical protein D9758_012571 [Tetrapyrgos nigripes]|uniref:Protein LCHN n=1 Tax=Tetrapyrgos nigripes TaxID=182062 RepID=A0A8H5CIB2_9AGAR|nr:hypothetical protein D9758_012571 [Tetrapyrgos nigripes]